MTIESGDDRNGDLRTRFMGKFIGEKINVTTAEEEPLPLGFIWRGKKYEITEIVRSWHDYGFSPAAPRKRNWLMRRHRNVYIVKTNEGEEFEIYLDRGAGKRDWYLYRRLK